MSSASIFGECELMGRRSSGDPASTSSLIRDPRAAISFTWPPAAASLTLGKGYVRCEYFTDDVSQYGVSTPVHDALELVKVVEEGENLGVEAVGVNVDDGGHPQFQEGLVFSGKGSTLRVSKS